MPLILFITFAAAVGLYIVQPLADPDLWWHVVSGRWIAANLAVPKQDLWTMFAKDMPWTAYSWSNEVVFALFERWFGLQGLLFLQMLLAVIFAMLLAWTLGRVSQNYILGSLLAAVIVCSSHAHFALRPQTVVWLYLTLVIFISENILRNQFTRGNVMALAAVFCAWANSHITTIIGLGVLAAWLCPQLPWKPVSLRFPAIAILTALLATLITPYFGYEWIIFFSKSGHPLAFTSIQEFSPANILQTPTAFLLLSSALVCAFCIIAPYAVTVTQLCGAAVLTLGSLAVIKFLPFAMIYLGFILARQWRAIGAERASEPGLVQAFQRLEDLIRRIPREGLSFVLICSAIVNVHNTWNIMIDSDYLPVKTIDFVKNEKLPLPIMNTFGDGGYISYRFADRNGHPGVQVSIDGRTNLISHQLWEEYQQSWHGRWGWKNYIDKVKPKTIVWRSDSALIRILEAEGQWCTVFNREPKSVSSVVMLEKTTVAEMAANGSKVRCL